MSTCNDGYHGIQQQYLPDQDSRWKKGWSKVVLQGSRGEIIIYSYDKFLVLKYTYMAERKSAGENITLLPPASPQWEP